MRLSLSSSIFLLFLRPLSVSLSALPEDLEASGYDLDSSGSGFGDGSELVSPGEIKNIKNELKNKDGGVFTADSGEGNDNILQGSSDLSFDHTYRLPRFDATEFVLLSNGKSFLNHQEIHAGIIAGGVTGATVGAALSAILIYTRKRKDRQKCQKNATNEDCHKANRKEAFV
ncbi:uncharacterized protein PAE49_001538 [Odontesthes bonariensis]